MCIDFFSVDHFVYVLRSSACVCHQNLERREIPRALPPLHVQRASSSLLQTRDPLSCDRLAICPACLSSRIEVAQDDRSSLYRPLAHDRRRPCSRLSSFIPPAPAVMTQPLDRLLPADSVSTRSCPLRPRPPLRRDNTPHNSFTPSDIVPPVLGRLRERDCCCRLRPDGQRAR